MTQEKPIKLTLDDLERPSMNASETYNWLKNNKGLDFSIPWDPNNPRPVLMITTEKFRELVVPNAPDLLVTSFVIVRNPVDAKFNKGYRLYYVSIPYSGPDKSTGREYDVYSIIPQSGEVIFVQPRKHSPQKVSGFQTELPYCVIDENNKKILEELGCNFKW